MTDRNDLLTCLFDPVNAPLFVVPTRRGVTSAWYGHIPFASWIVHAVRPDLLVELGTHAGVSYSAFCDAVIREHLPTRCVAVDTWMGDEHAGTYGEEIFSDLKSFHDVRYAEFSTLRRATFDEALADFADGSIDLLHIDGRHFYDDVRHDFETWLPKLSDRAVVLFHDTQVRERDFGVWRLWAELSANFPHFEFVHAHGLGVLAVGSRVPPLVASLCQTSGSPEADEIRRRVALLGERWMADWTITELREVAETAARRAVDASAVVDSQAREVAALVADRDVLRSDRDALRIDRDALRIDREALQHARDVLADTLSNAEARLTDARRHIVGLDSDLQQTRDALTSSLATIDQLKDERARFEALWLAERDRSAALMDRLTETEAAFRLVVNSRPWRAIRQLRRIIGRPPEPSLRSEPLPPIPLDATTAPDAKADAAQGCDPSPAGSATGKTLSQRVIFVSGEPHTPGHHYRVLRLAAAARAVGWESETARVDELDEAVVAGAAAVVFWRVKWFAPVERAYALARGAGAKIVFDIDDLMFRPELARIEVIDGIRSQSFTEEGTAELFRLVGIAALHADLCLAATDELAWHLRTLQQPTFVIQNSFDDDVWRLARREVRRRDAALAAGQVDGRVRIGYAAGSRTHQRDLAVAAPALARVLAARPECLLVLFRAEHDSGSTPLIDLHELPELASHADQIEWRAMVPAPELSTELARFDINIAPLEVGNPFCEAKSELKYFEAALVSVPTIASPTGPYRRAIAHGVTGFLAADDAAWFQALAQLVADPLCRARVARAAYLDALSRFGPSATRDRMATFLAQIEGGPLAARSFARHIATDAGPPAATPTLPEADVLFSADRGADAEVTVIIPLYNYADTIVEALDSVTRQTLSPIDLVVVDDASTDDSARVALAWVRANAPRLNRIRVVQHRKNAGLGCARNTGFINAETPFVLPLDADNRLLPDCAERLLDALRDSSAAFAYPAIRRFGDDEKVCNAYPFQAMRFIGGNFIDAMALVAVWAWAAVGGFNHIRHGWEDFDFWARLVELGLWGVSVPETLAEYRVHGRSMLVTETDIDAHKRALIDDLRGRHPWLQIPI